MYTSIALRSNGYNSVNSSLRYSDMRSINVPAHVMIRCAHNTLFKTGPKAKTEIKTRLDCKTVYVTDCKLAMLSLFSQSYRKSYIKQDRS